MLVASLAAAQEPSPAPQSAEVLSGPQQVDGQIVRPGSKSMLPVPHVWVTLHRVGSDQAAPLDSVRADSQGKYRFNFRRTGDESALYFVSASYGGVAYFTPPLRHNTVRGAEAEIAVFDTTSAPVPISIRGHHLIISAADANSARTITEVYELANDSSVTRVAPSAGDDAVWSAPYPQQAMNLRVAQGDIPGAAVKFSGGAAKVFAPIAPGLKQLAFSYTVPASAFPMSFPTVRDTQILEVLIEEEKGTVTGAKLVEKDPVSLETRSFRRFLADDVAAASVAVIDLPKAGSKATIDARYMIGLTAAFGLAMILALARALRRR